MKKEQYSPIAYEAPIVKVIEVEVEKGYACSLSGSGPDSDDTEFGN